MESMMSGIWGDTIGLPFNLQHLSSLTSAKLSRIWKYLLTVASNLRDMIWSEQFQLSYPYIS